MPIRFPGMSCLAKVISLEDYVVAVRRWISFAEPA